MAALVKERKARLLEVMPARAGGMMAPSCRKCKDCKEQDYGTHRDRGVEHVLGTRGGI